jgi:hypothetical protein
VGVVAALTGRYRVAEEAEAKNKGKKRRKKKPVCTCSTAGCVQRKVKKPSKLIDQDPRCTYAGACTTNPCAAPVPPPDPQCTTSTECTDGRVCADGRCEGCTGFAQCGTTTTVGHLACLEGRCRGNEPCASDAQCFGLLQCAVPPGGGAKRCLSDDFCAHDDDCPGDDVCVLANCTSTCVSDGDCVGDTCQGGACLPF